MKYTRKQREAAAELCAIAAEGRKHGFYTTWDAANYLDGRDLEWPDETDPVRVLADDTVVALFQNLGLSAFESARDLYLTAAAEILSDVKELRDEDR